MLHATDQLRHKALLFTRGEADCSKPLHFSTHSKEKVSEASVEHEGVRVGGKLSEQNENDFSEVPPPPRQPLVFALLSSSLAILSVCSKIE